MFRFFFMVTLLVLPIGGLDHATSTADAPSERKDRRIDDTALLTIGDDPDEALHEVIGAVLMDDVLILAEKSTSSLRYHDRATGQLLHTVGGEGEGPGEYVSLDLVEAIGDKLYTFDNRLWRVTVRDRSGALERTVPIRPWGNHSAADVKGFFPDGSILVSAWAFGWAEAPMIRRFNIELGRHDPAGTLAESLGTHLGSEHYASPETMSIYPYRREVWVVVVGDRYHVVDNTDPVIRAFDATGNPVNELDPYQPLEPRTLTSGGRDSVPDLDGIDPDDLPRFYPYYGRPRAVGGALWVPDYDGLAPGGGSGWTVYSPDGGLVGRVAASELDIIVLAADDDNVAVLTRDAFDVQTVELRRLTERP
ncbi:hypothetical protein [Candidatus Palauibacter sp.]|uniref:hypothetical protein n=1 Tax=Candidatus Palauibacter sp. TaxID=3101350 RepID=UPI003B51EEA3